MNINKKYILSVLLIGVFSINIPILATAGEWSASGTTIYYLDGNVGIGRDTVSIPLHIRKNSTIDIGQKIELESNLTGVNWEALRIDANANTSHANSISWEFDSITGSNGPAISAYRTSGTETDLSFSVTDNDSRFELMRLQGSTGNVGIGVVNPGTKLSVNGGVFVKGNAETYNNGELRISTSSGSWTGDMYLHKKMIMR